MINQLEELISIKQKESTRNQEEITKLYEAIQTLESNTERLRTDIDKLNAALEVIKQTRRPSTPEPEAEPELAALEPETDIPTQTKPAKLSIVKELTKEPLKAFKKDIYKNISYIEIIKEVLRKGETSKKGLIMEIFNLPDSNTQTFEATINSSLWKLCKDGEIVGRTIKGVKYYRLNSAKAS